MAVLLLCATFLVVVDAESTWLKRAPGALVTGANPAILVLRAWHAACSFSIPWRASRQALLEPVIFLCFLWPAVLDRGPLGCPLIWHGSVLGTARGWGAGSS